MEFMSFRLTRHIDRSSYEQGRQAVLVKGLRKGFYTVLLEGLLPLAEYMWFDDSSSYFGALESPDPELQPAHDSSLPSTTKTIMAVDSFTRERDKHIYMYVCVRNESIRNKAA